MNFQNMSLVEDLLDIIGQNNENKPSAVLQEIDKELMRIKSCNEENEFSFWEHLVEIHNETIVSSDTVCIITECTSLKSEEAWLSFIYAVIFNKRFCIIERMNEFETFASSTDIQSIFMILPYEGFDFDRCYRANLLNQLIGYLPYANSGTILNYIRKMIEFQDNTKDNVFLILNRIQQKNDQIAIRQDNNSTFIYYPKNECTLANFTDATKPETTLLEFNYIAHSRECSIVLDDFLYCNFHEINKDFLNEASRFLPSCFYNSEHCYTKNRKILSSKQLEARILFLNGCNIGDLSSSFIPYPYTVISQLIEGDSVSIITSPNIKVGDVVENILAHNLLKYGYSEGEKLYFVNNFLVSTNMENNLYYQIGDPTVSFGVKRRISEHLEIAVLQREYYLQVPGVKEETFVEIIIVPTGQIQISNLYLSDIKLFNNGKEVPAENIYYNLTKSLDGNNNILMIFSKDPISADAINLTISPLNFIEINKDKMESMNLNFEFYKQYFNLHSSMKGKLVDLQNQLINVHHSLKTATYDWEAMIKVRQTIRKIEAKCVDLSQEIFSHIVNYTVRHSDVFYERIGQYRSEAGLMSFDNFCYECDKATGHFFYKIITQVGKLERVCFKCLHCGAIVDAADTKITFKGVPNIKMTSNGLVDTTIFNIENHHDYSITLQGAAISVDTKEIEIYQNTEITLSPKENYEFKVRIKPNDDLKKGYYLFSFYFMAGTKFYYLSKMIGYGN